MKRPTCGSCGIEIGWQPTLVGSVPYCCTGCAEGGPCTCDYGLLKEQPQSAALAVRKQQTLPAETRRDAL